MSEDEEVTLFQAVWEAAPTRVTPSSGKGALGTRWPRMRRRSQTLSWFSCGLSFVAKGRRELHGLGVKGVPAPQLRTVQEGPP